MCRLGGVYAWLEKNAYMGIKETFKQGCAWVGLRGFFDPTHHGGSKKIQPDPTHHISSTQPTRVGLGQVEPMGLTNFFSIIIKLSRKKKYINILKKPKYQYQCNSLKANNTNNKTTIVSYQDLCELIDFYIRQEELAI